MNKYVKIPENILYDPNLNPAEFRIYVIISGYINHYGSCNISNSKLAEELKLSKNHVSSIIQSLDKKGYLKIEISRNGKGYLRDIQLPDPIPKNHDTYNEKSLYPIPKNHDRVNPKTAKKKEKPIMKNHDIQKNHDIILIKDLNNILIQNLKELYPGIKDPNEKRWTDEFISIHTLDKVSYEDLKEALEWIFKNEFWKDKIISPMVLRKHLDRIMIQMIKDKKKDLPKMDLRFGTCSLPGCKNKTYRKFDNKHFCSLDHYYEFGKRNNS